MRIRPNSCKICKICKTQFYPTIVSRCVLDNCPLHPKQSYGDFCVSCVNNVQCCAPPRTTRQFEKIMVSMLCDGQAEVNLVKIKKLR